MSVPGALPARSSHSQATAKVVAAAAAATGLVLAGLCIFFFYRLRMARKRLKHRFKSSFRREAVPAMVNQGFRQQGPVLQAQAVDERGQFGSLFSKVWNNPISHEEEKTRHSKGVDLVLREPGRVRSYAKEAKPLQQAANLLPKEASKPLNPPGESALANQTPPPPPPPLPPKRFPKPPPVPVQAKVSLALSGGRPKLGNAFSRGKPPLPLRQEGTSSRREENGDGNGESRVKLKPLHWEKVTANVDHSMVWHKISDGSFRFEDDLMETLFGYSPTRKESTEGSRKTSGVSTSASNAQSFILDPRKSQNTAIVIKSLAISRKEIIDALVEGRGLNAETLEKLTKIAPTEQESASIFNFDGDLTKLADAESFLYYILKAVPSAFIRLNAMLFRSNYDPEMLHFKESVQALELACTELRTPGIFLKLLEAILKAGNRLNAGTCRGNAQGFDLSALRKLSNVKSTDGKTTLLHFVVEQVARFEGRRPRNQEDDRDAESKIDKEEREREYLTLGLPLVRCLSTELSNVRKASAIDYNSFINTCSSLTMRANDIRKALVQCGESERGEFVWVMETFLEECNAELKVIREEQIRVMEMVKSTTEYYQAGGAKDKTGNTHPLQLFLILKEFIDMVDQACVDISRKLHRAGSFNNGVWSPPPSPTPGTPVRFHNLNMYFLQQNGESFSSDSEDGF